MIVDLQLFGGRGGSSGGGGSSGNTVITEYDGSSLTLSHALKTGAPDSSVADIQRKRLESFEKRHAKSDIEWGRTIDINGKVLENHSGNSGSVSFNNLDNAAYLTHIHPRENGALGGTFSIADINVLSYHPNMKNIRAKAKEGTYSLSKTSSFDRDGFVKYANEQHSINRATYEKAYNRYYSQLNSGKISYSEYEAKSNNAFNNYLIKQHNSFLKGQKTYGYTYVLEKK